MIFIFLLLVLLLSPSSSLRLFHKQQSVSSYKGSIYPPQFLSDFSQANQSFKDKKCSVIINGVDLSTKVEGKIVGYKGSSHDYNTMMTRSTVKVLKSNGQTNIEMVMVPIINRRYTQQVNCESNFEKEIDPTSSQGEEWKKLGQQTQV